MATVDYEQDAPSQEAADIAQANRMRKDMKQAQEAATGFRKQQEVAALKAEAAERVVEGCAAALRVLDPQDKPMPNTNGEYAGPEPGY